MQSNDSSIASELNIQPFHRDILHHRSRTAWRSYTKWTTQWNEGHGWINWYHSWRNGGLLSPVAQRSPRTPSTYSACTSTWRKGGASWRYARCSVVPSSPWCLITVVFHCLLYLCLFFVNSIYFFPFCVSLIEVSSFETCEDPSMICFGFVSPVYSLHEMRLSFFCW